MKSKSADVTGESIAKISVSILIATFICCTEGYAQNAKEIVEKYYAAVSKGDFKNWLKIRSVYIEGESDSRFENQIQLGTPTKSTFKTYRVWPDKCTGELFQDSVLVSKTYHLKDKSFLVMGNAVMPVSPGPYERYFEFDPVLIKKAVDKSRKTELVGIKVIDLIKCYDVKIDTKELLWHFYFNADNYLLEYWNNSPDGSPTETLTKVFDYKEFNNCLIPMSEVKTKNGSPFFWSTRTKVELNIDIDPGKFEYQGGDLEKP